MKNFIKNSILKIVVDSIGAELNSIQTVADNFEYLWQSDPQYWRRQSPLLFPIVGRVKDDHYRVDGKEYPMENHGFVKECRFELVDTGPQLLVYQLESNKDTLQKYPYHFRLQVSYRLDGRELEVGYTVKNLDQREMFFSIGAHTGFRCPLTTSDTMNDYRLEFEKAEQVERYLLKDNLFTGGKELFLNKEKVLPLSYELFKKGAFVMKGLKSNQIVLKSDKTSRSAKVSFKGFPYLVIWSQPGPFVCIEPWYGVHGAANFEGDISEKEGIQALGVGEIFECSYRIGVA
jgi:galactose mutarotase-like enzyme